MVDLEAVITLEMIATGVLGSYFNEPADHMATSLLKTPEEREVFADNRKFMCQAPFKLGCLALFLLHLWIPYF